MHSYQNSNKCALHLIGAFSIGARRSYAFLCVSIRSDAFRDDGFSSFGSDFEHVEWPAEGLHQAGDVGQRGRRLELIRCRVATLTYCTPVMT